MTKEKNSPNPNRRNFLGVTLKSIPIAVASTVGLNQVVQAIPTLGYQLDMTPRQIYQSGIAACNVWCQEQYGKAFAELSDEQKHDAMTLLSDGKAVFTDDAVPSSTFFEQLWNNTKEGFFADPMYGGNREMVGWNMVGFPGARGDFLDWADKYNQSYPIPPVSIAPRKR